MTRKPKPKSRSGTQWSEAQLAERYDTVKLRLRPGYKARLEQAAGGRGRMSATVEGWIDAAESVETAIRLHVDPKGATK